MDLYPNFYPSRLLCWQHYTFWWLIRSALYCFGIGIQKTVLYFLLRPKTNYIRFNNLSIKGPEKTICGSVTETLKNLPEKHFHSLLFMSKWSFMCCGVFINFIVATVFINCSTLWKCHYCGHTCYTFGKNLISNETLVTYTLLITNTNKY